jgi:hypothetical protein
MPSARTGPSQSFDEKIFELLDESWRTVGEVRRLLGGGEALGVALALDRLCEAGLVEKDAARILVSVRRKGGGGELRFLKFRRKRSDGAPNATAQ